MKVKGLGTVANESAGCSKEDAAMYQPLYRRNRLVAVYSVRPLPSSVPRCEAIQRGSGLFRSHLIRRTPCKKHD